LAVQCLAAEDLAVKASTMWAGVQLTCTHG